MRMRETEHGQEMTADLLSNKFLSDQKSTDGDLTLEWPCDPRLRRHLELLYSVGPQYSPEEMEQLNEACLCIRRLLSLIICHK